MNYVPTDQSFTLYRHKREPVVFPLTGIQLAYFIEEARTMKKLNEVQTVKQEEKKRGCAESKGICKMCKVCRENNKKRIDS